ncbi:sugar nucleotide-binding protein, partial [Vibrio parahaemolyticus]
FASAIFDVAVEQKVLAKKPILTSITTDQFPTPAKRPSNSRLSNEKIMKGFSVEASDWKNALNNIQAYTG